MFERLAEAMEQPELASAGRFGPKELRLAARDEVNKIVAVGLVIRSSNRSRAVREGGRAGQLDLQYRRYFRRPAVSRARQHQHDGLADWGDRRSRGCAAPVRNTRTDSLAR